MSDGRPSGVPGLVILGDTSSGYRLYCEPEGGELRRIYDHELHRFRTIRDAKAAAERMAELLPWNDEAALRETVKAWREFDPRGYDSFARSFLEAVTGQSWANLRAERERRESESRARYDGTGPRDDFDSALRGLGHDPAWRRKGQRSHWGTCQNCGQEFRVSYRSMSKSYDRQGGRVPCGADQ